MNERELVSTKKITKDLIINFILWGIPFGIIYSIVYAFISGRVESLVLKAILGIAIQGIMVFFMWKFSTISSFKKNTIEYEDVPKVMKNLLVFTIILCAINCIYQFSQINGIIEETFSSYEYKLRENLMSNFFDEEEKSEYENNKNKEMEEVKKQLYVYVVVLNMGLTIAYLSALPLEKREIFKAIDDEKNIYENNNSKKVIIISGILVAIPIILLVIWILRIIFGAMIYKSALDSIENVDLDTVAVQTANSKYEVYLGDEIQGTKINYLLEKVFEGDENIVVYLDGKKITNKNSIRTSKKYNATSEKDSDGYINKIIITTISNKDTISEEEKINENVEEDIDYLKEIMSDEMTTEQMKKVGIKFYLLEDGTYAIGSNEKKYDESLDYEYYEEGYKGKLTEIIIPSKIDGIEVTKIGAYAFKDSDMVKIVIPDTINEIGNSAFYSCDSLEEIKIPEKVQYIGEMAFGDCRKLQNISLPEEIKTLDKYAFYACFKLKHIVVPRNINEIYANAFFDSGLKTIYYEGTEEEWKNVKIICFEDETYDENSYMRNANVEYEYKEN